MSRDCCSSDDFRQSLSHHCATIIIIIIQFNFCFSLGVFNSEWPSPPPPRPRLLCRWMEDVFFRLGCECETEQYNRIITPTTAGDAHRIRCRPCLLGPLYLCRVSIWAPIIFCGSSWWTLYSGQRAISSPFNSNDNSFVDRQGITIL